MFTDGCRVRGTRRCGEAKGDVDVHVWGVVSLDLVVRNDIFCLVVV